MGVQLHSLLIFLLMAGMASAQGRDELVRRFENARALLGQQSYAEAQREFLAVYRKHPVAAVLYEMGQTALRSGDIHGARQYFERYLLAEPQASDRMQVEEWVALCSSVLDNEKHHRRSRAQRRENAASLQALLNAPMVDKSQSFLASLPPEREEGKVDKLYASITPVAMRELPQAKSEPEEPKRILLQPVVKSTAPPLLVEPSVPMTRKKKIAIGVGVTVSLAAVTAAALLGALLPRPPQTTLGGF
jgi:hypothetical protein